MSEWDSAAAARRLDELDALISVFDAQNQLRARLDEERELLNEAMESHDRQEQQDDDYARTPDDPWAEFEDYYDIWDDEDAEEVEAPVFEGPVTMRVGRDGTVTLTPDIAPRENPLVRVSSPGAAFTDCVFVGGGVSAGPDRAS